MNPFLDTIRAEIRRMQEALDLLRRLEANYSCAPSPGPALVVLPPANGHEGNKDKGHGGDSAGGVPKAPEAVRELVRSSPRPIKTSEILAQLTARGLRDGTIRSAIYWEARRGHIRKAAKNAGWTPPHKEAVPS